LCLEGNKGTQWREKSKDLATYPLVQQINRTLRSSFDTRNIWARCINTWMKNGLQPDLTSLEPEQEPDTVTVVSY